MTLYQTASRWLLAWVILFQTTSHWPWAWVILHQAAAWQGALAVGVGDTVPDGVAGAVAMAVGVDKAVVGMGVVVAVGVWGYSRRPQAHTSRTATASTKDYPSSAGEELQMLKRETCPSCTRWKRPPQGTARGSH